MNEKKKERYLGIKYQISNTCNKATYSFTSYQL